MSGRWKRVVMVALASLALSSGANAAGKPSAGASKISSSAQGDTLVRREGHPRIFLTWDAPHRMPRAKDAITVACDDTTAADTLYLTFDPGEDLGAFMAVDATLYFRSAPGDSLGPFWDLSRNGVNPWNLRIEFDEPPAGAVSPWAVAGYGAPRYHLTRDTGRLDLTYYVAASKAAPVAAGTQYFFARVMLRLRKPYLGGCKQAACVELGHLLLSYSGGSRWITDGDRFVSWNSTDGAACRDARKRTPDQEPEKFGGRAVPTSPDSTRR